MGHSTGNHKQQPAYGFVSNLIFMMREQWRFEKKGVFLPWLRIPSDIAVSVLALWIPKVVLDAIANAVPAHEFLLQISLYTIAMMILIAVSYYTEQSMYKNAVKIWNLHFYIEKEWKIVDMDYAHFASPAGKIKIERAHLSLNRNVNVNMVSFYVHVVELAKNMFGFLSFCALLITLSPVIIILLVFSYVIDGLLVWLIERWEHQTKNERARIDRKLDYVIQRTSDSSIAKDMRIYHMAPWIDSMTARLVKEKLTWQQKIASRRFMHMLFEALLIFVRNGGAYLFLLWKMFSSNMSVGEFVLYFGAIAGFGQWLEQIVKRIGKLAEANYKVDDYRDFMDTNDKWNRGRGVALPPAGEPVEITLDNVSFNYEGSDSLILENIHLQIRQGEKLAIVGTNGAGKTTIVKLICGLLEPVAGRVLMNGTDIREFNRDEYYARITAVFQQVSLLPASIAKNITFRSDDQINWERLERCAELAGIHATIGGFPQGYHTNLVPSVTTHGVELSGGEQQKLMLARALYKDAPLIILDEPTAALDPIAEHQMYLQYDELTRDKTAIYISHRLASTRFCDKIILIDHRRIAEMGTHDELMALGGTYKNIYDVQSRYYRENVREEAI